MLTRSDFDQHTQNKNADGTIRIDSKIVCRENQSEYRYINASRQQVAKIKIDDGLVPQKKLEKCDWLLVNWDCKISFFIELKGSDVFKAVSQIESTIRYLKSDLGSVGVEKCNARIVPTKNPIPNYKSDARYKKFDKLIKEHHGTIIIRSRLLEEIQ